MPNTQKTPRTPSPEFLTVADVATRWAVGQQLVRRLIADRSLPARKIGAAVRIRLVDVVAYEDDEDRTHGKRPR